MKILLTGPTGFIGSAFARLALSRGHQVGGLIIPGEQPPAGLEDTPNLEWFRGTLAEPPWEKIQAFEPQVCLHTAWITTPGVYLESPENYRFLEASVAFLRRLVSFGTRHIAGLGTCIEYQIGNQPLSETTTPIAPSTTYARCKDELRRTLESEARNGGFDFCWARIFYPYGPGEHPSRLCSSLIQRLSRNEEVTLKTPNSTKDYIFITDLAEALLTILEKRFAGPINVGTGAGLSVRTVAQTIGKLLGKTSLVKEIDPPEPDPFPFVVADATKLRALNWQPRHTLEQGIGTLLQMHPGV